jgi:cytochrome P450
MLRWNRTVFRDVFLNLDNDPRVRETAARSSNEMNDYLRTLIRERKAILADGGKLEDNMLNRLIEMQGGDAPFFTDDEIRSNIAGVFLGALELTSKACVNVLQQFFARKDVLEQARKAALADDVETMNKLAMEAMRFQPNMPVLLRYCGARQTIGGNGRRKRTVPAGKKVFAVISSAMFDRRTMTKPGRFDAQRPAGDYLYYGFGQHACFGTYINFVSIPEMLVALLRIKDLQPVAGKRGEVVYEGPFPKSWKWIRG